MAYDREEIRQEARRIFAARGIDPNVAERVIKQESGFNPAARNINPKERSYGLAQLNEQGGLGAVALKKGIDPKDPNQWRRHLEFMADTVKQDGWRQWYGARDVGIGRWQGVKEGAGGVAPSAASNTPMPPRRPSEVATTTAAAPLPNSPLLDVGAPDRGVLSPTVDPFKIIADTVEKQQAEQKAAQLAAQLAAQQAQPPPQAPAPAPLPPPPQVDYAGLIMPRIKRGLLADDYSSGLLGAA
jgi:hypothetical protein